jgi:hypothetical protein
MKKSKILVGVTAFALAVGGFYASKANHKFFAFNGKFAGTNATGTLSLNSTIFTSVQSGSLKTCVLATASATHIKIATLLTMAGVQKVYRK